MGEPMHLDAKRDERLGTWLIWCGYRKCWATVTDDWFCAGCGGSVANRFSEAERDRKSVSA